MADPGNRRAAEVRDGLKAILRLLHDAGNDFTDERILHRLLRAFSIAIDVRHLNSTSL
jgi:2-C-methyl-D-erythritol 4-phosphate cytidylyltransferase